MRSRTDRSLRSAVRRVLLLGAGAANIGSFAAHAQTVGSESMPEKLETVVVTGTRISRVESEGALPVQVITQEQLQRTGAVNVEQFLQTVSVAVQGNTNTVAASGSGSTTGGVSTVSLRGLGSTRTLVLINGRRIAGGGTITDSSSVDVNGIPMAAVERVEVLKDGASAIYGSDAIAGVINFILKENFEGVEATPYYGTSSDGGGAVKRFSATVGLGSLAQDRYNVMLSASYQQEQALYGSDRRFAKSSINVAANNDVTSAHTFPGNVFFTLPDGTPEFVNPRYPNCAPSMVDPLVPDPYCAYDPSPYVALLPDVKRTNVYGTAHFALTDAVELYAEASFNRNQSEFIIQPAPFSEAFALPPNHPLFNVSPYNGFSTIILSPSSPYYPTAFVQGLTGGATPDLSVFYRSVVTGNRDITDTSDQPRAVFGVKGSVSGWDYDANVLYSETKLTEHVNNGYPSQLALLPLFNSGQVNFFGPNTAAVQAQVDATQYHGDAYSTKTSLAGFGASVSKELVSLSAGALAVAFGGEYRKEKFSTDPSAAIASGDIAGYGGNFLPVDVSRNVEAVFAELNVPLLKDVLAAKSLELGIAGRYDNYQGTGNKTTPKVDVRWRPLEQLLVRASYGKGFRAPSLIEIYGPQTTGVTNAGLNDPARCDVPDANGNTHHDPKDCGTQFPTLQGGNTKLKPELSDNYTVGIVFEPTHDFSVGLDAFRINLKDTIIFGISPTAILADTSTFGYLVTRGAPDASTPGLPGHIVQIDQRDLNLGETKVDGVDLDLRMGFNLEALGRILVYATGTYFDKYEIQNLDGTFQSINGQVTPIVAGAGGVIPRWHHYASVDWKWEDWDVSVAQNFQSHYRDLPGNLENRSAPGFKPREVASYVTHDVQAAFSGIEHLRFAVGAKNVFNRDPPYTNGSGFYFQAGYDPGYVDPRGRFYYGSVTYSTK